MDNKNSDLIQYIKALSNEKGRIVLISSLKTIPSEWINLQLFHIIPKELNYENVKECLNCYFKLIDFKKFFHYTKNGAKCIIAVSKIKYIKSNDKKITIYTSNDSIEFYGKLYECKNDETLKNFIKTHQSFLVNPDYIEQLGRYYMILKGDIKIPISRNSYKEIKNKFLRL